MEKDSYEHRAYESVDDRNKIHDVICVKELIGKVCTVCEQY